MALPNLAGLSLHAAAPTGVDLTKEEHDDWFKEFHDLLHDGYGSRAAYQRASQFYYSYKKSDHEEWDPHHSKYIRALDELLRAEEVVERIEADEEKFQTDLLLSANHGVEPPKHYSGKRAERLEREYDLWKRLHPGEWEARQRRLERGIAEDAAAEDARRQADPNAWAAKQRADLEKEEMRKNAEAWRKRPAPPDGIFDSDRYYDDDPYLKRVRHEPSPPSDGFLKRKAEAVRLAREQQRQAAQGWERQRQAAQEAKRKKEGMAEIQRKEIEYQRKYEAEGKLDEYIENLKGRLWNAINRDRTFARSDWKNQLQAILDDSSLDYARPDRIKQLQLAVTQIQGIKKGFYP